VKARRHVLGGYAIWMAVLIATYYGRPGWRAEAWGLIGLSGVAAIVAGVVINRPSRKAPWLLLAAALTSFTAGQVSFLVAQLVGVELPFPSFADVLYLLTYPLYAAGLLIFIWWRTPDRDRRSLIDALILTAGLALLSWTYLVLPYVHNPGLSWLQKSVAIAYPLGDVLMLAMLARLLAPGAGRTRSVEFLTVGAVGTLVSDTLFGLIQLHGTFHNGTPIDLGWVVFYGGWGAAALHPTMTELTQPVNRQHVEVSLVRLTVLMLASLIAPVVLFTESFRVRGGDGSVIAVFSAILYLLVLSRLSDVAASHRRALGRERAVRQAGASLVSAVTVDQVGAIVKSATDILLGTPRPGDVLLAVRIDGAFRAVTTASADPGPMRRLGELAETWVPLAVGSAPILAPVANLPQPAQAVVPAGDWTLLCPLTLNDRPSGDPLIGVLAVLGGQRALADLSATLEILAHQVALAVERILLRDELIHQRNEAYFRTLVQDTSDAILIVGDDWKVRYATPSATSIFGDIAMEGAYLWALVADGQREELLRVFTRIPAGASFSNRYVDRRITRRDGVTVQVQVRASDLRADPTVAGLVLTLRDVTEQRQLEEQLKYQAFHDALTGLPNRLLFQDRISQQLAAAREEGTTVGVLFVDLDDFKVVNDTMGHGIGDELLVATAVRLTAMLRESDTAARLGGDEFALLIGDVTSSAAVEAVADRIVRAFGEPFALASGAVLTTVTVGVATTEDSADTDELLRHADLALYAAKAAGKRQWRRYQPVLSAGMVRRRELQAALEEAVARSAFTLAYQPIVTLATGELAGFEALVRWPHPQWGMMQPDQFIALAEETGQIVPLGSWVLGRAAADIARWRREPRVMGAPAQVVPPAVPASGDGHGPAPAGGDGRGPVPAGADGRGPAPAGGDGRGPVPAGGAPSHGLYVSVNVSARQFSTPGFVDGVRQILDSSGLEPGALMLELTESVLLRRNERVAADLTELKAIGVKLAIDDFGTGYSSLSYLRELPIDVLKMDKSFVDGIAVSEQRLALAEGIVQIARTLRLEVIAEGIESEVQRDLLTSMGCQFGQGYLLAMPMAAHQAETLARIGSHQAPRLPRQVPEPRETKPTLPAPRLTRPIWAVHRINMRNRCPSERSSSRPTGPTSTSSRRPRCCPSGRSSSSTTRSAPSSWGRWRTASRSTTSGSWRTARSSPAAGGCRCAGTERPGPCPPGTTGHWSARSPGTSRRSRPTRCA
jgi:diguanylate cyclase (GGDEF)-like protein/PAS domain S-box-containing protein